MTSSLTGIHSVTPGERWATTRGPIVLVSHAPTTRVTRPANAADPGRGATAGAVAVPRAPNGRRASQRSALAVRFAEMLAETMRGIRPVGQLRPVATEQCLLALADARRHAGIHTARCVRVRAGAPRAGIVDAVACYAWKPGAGNPARTFAVTFRLRQSSRGWRCIQLDVVGADVRAAFKTSA